MSWHNPLKKLSSVDKPVWLALAICGLCFLFWFNLLIKKFIHFGYYDWDLAMYAQATWALSQGSMHSSLFGTSFLTNHAEYIAFFLAPIYKLFPSAFTLIIFKILSLTGGAFVFYLIIKKTLGWRLGIILMLLYLIHPANLFMLIYEFHFENLAILFIFLMFYFMQNQKLIPFLISAFFATIVKENISLIVFLFGIYILIKREPKGKGWLFGSLILGLGFFILTMFIMTPYLRMQEGIATTNQYLSIYWHQPESHNLSPIQIILKNLSIQWYTLTSPVNLNYIKELFLPFHILPFFSPLTLLLGSTIFLQHFLATTATMHSVYYHYAATAIIFIFLSTGESLYWIKKHVRPFIFSTIILITIAGYLINTNQYLPEFKRRVAMWDDRLDPIRQNMINRIPPQASLVSSFDFLSQLTERPELYSLHNVWQNYETFTGKTPFVLPSDLSYALIDWNCSWLRDDLLYSEHKATMQYLKNINTLYFSRSWHIVDAVEDVTLLSTQPQKTSRPPLSENSTSPFPITNSTISNIKIGKHLHLINLSISPSITPIKGVLPLTFIWQSRSPTTDFISVNIKILKNNTSISERNHILGYAFNATPLWQKGQYIRENYNLWLSNLAPDKYTLKISFFNLNKNRPEDIISDEQFINQLNLDFCYLCPNPN